MRKTLVFIALFALTLVLQGCTGFGSDASHDDLTMYESMRLQMSVD